MSYGGARRAGTTSPAVASTGSKVLTRWPEAIGLNPLMSGARIEDEGLFLVQHKDWQDAMRRALSAEIERNAKEQAHV
jgi:hypothetical protein